MSQINEQVLDQVVRRCLPNLLAFARQQKRRGRIERYLKDSESHIWSCGPGIVEDYRHAMAALRGAPP